MKSRSDSMIFLSLSLSSFLHVSKTQHNFRQQHPIAPNMMIVIVMMNTISSRDSQSGMINILVLRIPASVLLLSVCSVATAYLPVTYMKYHIVYIEWFDHIHPVHHTHGTHSFIKMHSTKMITK